MPMFPCLSRHQRRLMQTLFYHLESKFFDPCLPQQLVVHEEKPAELVLTLNRSRPHWKLFHTGPKGKNLQWGLDLFSVRTNSAGFSSWTTSCWGRHGSKNLDSRW